MDMAHTQHGMHARLYPLCLHSCFTMHVLRCATRQHTSGDHPHDKALLPLGRTCAASVWVQGLRLLIVGLLVVLGLVAVRSCLQVPPVC